MSYSYIENDWLKCAKWLHKCGVLPPVIHRSIENNQFELNNFKNALRDGIVLCKLINILVPGSIDTAKLDTSLLESLELVSLRSSILIEALKHHFGFEQKDLFEPNALWNMEFSILNAIAKLSQTQVALGKVNDGFALTDEYGSSDDGIASDVSSDSGEQENRKSKMKNNECFCEIYKNEEKYVPIKLFDVTKEIYYTEVSFVYRLRILVDEFLEPLVENIDDDRYLKIICENIKELKVLHSDLDEKLFETLFKRTVAGFTPRVCQIFVNLKLRFMKVYNRYFSNMQDAIDKINKLTNENKKFKELLANCNDKLEMNGTKAEDLIKLPFKRVLQYHMLFEKVHNKNENDETKKDTLSALIAMKELGNYLNELYTDCISLKNIEKLANKLNYDSKIKLNSIHDFGHFNGEFNVVIKIIENKNNTNEIKTKSDGKTKNDGEIKKRVLIVFDQALLFLKSKNGHYNHKETILLQMFELEKIQIDVNYSMNAKPETEIERKPVLHNVLHNEDWSKMYEIFCENDKEEGILKKAICDSKKRSWPDDYDSNGHSFSLKNFGDTITTCHLCKEILHGIFYQAYQCDNCETVVHKRCLNRCRPCKYNEPRWYCDVDHDMAEKRLKSITNDLPVRPVFLVRPIHDTGYVISVKLEDGNIKHIEIYAKINDNEQTYYFSKEENKFETITKLVEYFRKNPLESDLPKLGLEFKNACAGFAFVTENYYSKDVHLEKDELVSIISKNHCGDVLIHNSKGQTGCVHSLYLKEAEFILPIYT